MPTPTPPPVDASSTPWHRLGEQAVLTLLLGLIGSLLVARLSTAEPLGSANDRSRWCTVWSLGTQGTYRIDEIIRRPGWDTIDKVRHEGHFYSTKPPLFTTLLAGLYWGIHRATGLNLLNDTATVARIMLLLVNILPFLLALYCFWRALIRCDFAAPIRLLVIALAGLATLLTPFLTVLNNHTAGAISLLFTLSAAIFLLVRNGDSSRETGRGNGWLYAACGFFAALTCCNELPAALLGLGIFGLLVARDWRATATWFIPAALIPLIGFFVTNYLATGGWKPFYMYYGTEKYVYEHLGVASYWSNPQGVDKARDSMPVYVFHCLVGHHGIFSLTPLFLLMLPGYVQGIRHRTGGLRSLHLLGAALTVLILLFYWKRTENYNYGGVSVALRWVLWLIPFWLLAVAEWLQRCRRVYSLVLVLLILGSPSLYSAWSCWNTPWQHPWLFKSMESRGWINYSDPPEPLPRPIHGWVNGLPQGESADPAYWCLLGDGTGRQLRISDGGPTLRDGQATRIMILEQRDAQGRVSRSRIYYVLPDQLLAGALPGDYLVDWEDSDPRATRLEQLTFLRGTPAKAAYRAGHFRYLFTPVRENAFRCRRVALRAFSQGNEQIPAREIRSDLWLSEEVPYGIVQMQISDTERKQGQLIARETWTVISSGWENPSSH